jgi:hypothetical protein
MKPRGIKSIVDTTLGTLALCKDGSLWIARTIDATGKARWIKVDAIPKVDA